MKKLSDYRAEARTALKGNWLGSVMLLFVYMIIAVAISLTLQSFGDPEKATTSIYSLPANFLILPMMYGVSLAFLGQLRERDMQLGDLFKGYNKRVWLTMILYFVYIILWTLLLIIPGWIKSYSYAMTPYILVDDPEISNNAAIEKSMSMMQGHKWRLFLRDLSFIGWYILGAICFFVGMFWAAAYHFQARTAFYETLKAEQAEIA